MEEELLRQDARTVLRLIHTPLLDGQFDAQSVIHLQSWAETLQELQAYWQHQSAVRVNQNNRLSP